MFSLLFSKEHVEDGGVRREGGRGGEGGRDGWMISVISLLFPDVRDQVCTEKSQNSSSMCSQ